MVGKPYVIAVSAVSGGGKTTVAKWLAEQLPNSRVLYFDEFDLPGPEDIPKWIEEGGDPNAWDLTPLVDAFRGLCTESPDFFVLDYPFLYGHRQMSEFINLAVFIDTPLDIAMARRIMRDFAGRPVEDVIGDMKHYISSARPAYLDMLNTVKPQSDLIVDGMLPVPEIAKVIMRAMKAKAYRVKYPVLFREETQRNIQSEFTLALPDERLISNVNIVPFVNEQCVIIRLDNGHWEIPGGTLEQGEHYQETIRRELMEEAGGILLSYTTFGGWKCISHLSQPYKPHLPFPGFFRLVGYGDVELVSPPNIPESGGEKVVSVEILSVEEASERFKQQGRQDIAELYLLAAELRNQVR